uniref:Uncharacterized protein n=1 Tax=Picea glauca TaxID=3330 RepID=A0A117NIC8_PICGL|nr:hypothetical protein ABT39_MTgene2989 [Picea glauca]
MHQPAPLQSWLARRNLPLCLCPSARLCPSNNQPVRCCPYGLYACEWEIKVGTRRNLCSGGNDPN